MCDYSTKSIPYLMENCLIELHKNIKWEGMSPLLFKTNQNYTKDGPEVEDWAGMCRVLGSIHPQHPKSK